MMNQTTSSHRYRDPSTDGECLKIKRSENNPESECLVENVCAKQLRTGKVSWLSATEGEPSPKRCGSWVTTLTSLRPGAENAVAVGCDEVC